jgi:hypothetical protein
VFHFSTITFAGGNIVIFEESIDESNNVILKVSPDTPKQKQVIFSVVGTIFDDVRELDITFNEQEREYTITL